MSGVFVIAEAGVNHNGSIDLAIELIEAARTAGADAVKFQTFRADQLAARAAIKAPYQERTTSSGESQFAMLRRLELDAAAHRHLLTHCRETGIQFLSSPFDEGSADLLESMDVALYKIPSGEITNLPFLKHLAAKRRPLILSTGMSTLGEVEEAVTTIREGGNPPLTLLHCVTEYPAPYGEINLRAMETLRTAFGLPVGYSDHTPGMEISVAAVALGARVIEKHLTLSRTLPGPDHHASLEPAEFAAMITAIRHTEAALGNGIKAPAVCEIPNRPVARKSLVAARELPAGHMLSAGDLLVRRPGCGLAPKYLPALLGRTLRRAVAEEELINWDHLV